MRNPILSPRRAMLVLVILLMAGSLADAQTWSDFAHPNDPHRLMYNAPMSIPQLLTDPNERIELPVLVILLEFYDAQHQSFHTPAFFADMVFGEGGGQWTRYGRSMKQILREATNGRLEIMPAEEASGTLDDGIVGWVEAQCHENNTVGGYCVGGDRDNQECDVLSPEPCESGGGYCAPCASWDYYKEKVAHKRTEAIKRAHHPELNFAQYDTMDITWDDSSGGDGFVTDNELAIMIIHASPSCADHHHAAWPPHPDWGTGCGGGQATATFPAELDFDGVKLLQFPGVMSEAASPQVLTHEFGHQVFGLVDLYTTQYSKKNPLVTVHDGTISSNCIIEPGTSPCNDSCAAAMCVEDRTGWGSDATDYVARGSTVDAAGSSVTSCSSAYDTADVWYTYTPGVSGNVTITVAAETTGYLPSLAVFDGCGVENELDCTITSPLTVAPYLNAGTTYWIRIGGYGGSTGIYTLNIRGGGGTCDYPHDSQWEPQLATVLSSMKSSGTYSPHMSPWANIHLGFTRPLIVTEDGTYTLHRAETVRSSTQQISQSEALVIYDSTLADPYKEYFILENRAPLLKDGSASIDEGLAIWQIHDEFATKVDSRRTIRLVRPEVWKDSNYALWDGAESNCYDLTPWSMPKNTNWMAGSPSYIDILNISSAGSTMTVEIRLPGVFVDDANTGSEDGTQAHPWDTVSEGVDDVASSGRNQTIRIAPGAYPEDGLQISTPCMLVNSGETGTVYIGP